MLQGVLLHGRLSDGDPDRCVDGKAEPKIKDLCGADEADMEKRQKLYSKNSKFIEVPVSTTSFEEIHSFTEEKLIRNKISREILSETLIVLEAIYDKLLSQGFDQDTLLKVSVTKRFGEINIVLGFEGKPFAAGSSEPDISTPEDGILRAFEDKYDHSYWNGYNHIHITVKRSFQTSLLLGLGSVLLAILVYIPINAFVSLDDQLIIADNIVFPLVKMFSNAMLMVGAPVTFFSLLKNYTDIYVISKGNSVGRRLQAKTLITSVMAVVLAIATGFVVAFVMSEQLTELSEGTFIGGKPPSFPDLIESLVPASIFAPFETIMPVPLIVVAMIVTYAFCTVGKYFDQVKKAVDVCYVLFSRMLQVVMYVFPFFCFLAVMYPLLGEGYETLFLILEVIGMTVASLVVLAAFYLIRLLVGGVRLGPFLKRLPDFLKENYKIGSAIDAVPFNIRYCVRNYGMDRKRISDKFTVLAQLNLDGNCYLIMLVAMLFIFMLGNQASWYHIVVIAVLVVFLSFGAPNQPGSILIGTLIVALFLQGDVLIPTAVYLEAFLGGIQNLINVTGDVVTVAIEEKHVWKRDGERQKKSHDFHTG